MPRQPTCFRFGSVEVDERRFEMRIDGRAVEIEPKPLRVLLVLLQHAGALVTHEHLHEAVWNGNATVGSVLSNAVNKLRRALGPTESLHIATVAGLGYRFTGTLLPPADASGVAPHWRPQIGAPVPGKPNHRFVRELRRAGGYSLWEAHQHKSGNLIACAFAVDADATLLLKQIAAGDDRLRAALGMREDLVRALERSLDGLPACLEYALDGQSLKDWAARADGLATLPQQARLDLFLQIVDAVAAAHNLGVLHGQIDADSIRIVERLDGSLRASLAFHGHPCATGADTLVSTQGDVQALGLLLYRLLTGDLGRSLELQWRQHIGEPLLAEDIAAATGTGTAAHIGSAAELAARLRQLAMRGEQRRQREQLRQRAEWAERRLGRHRLGLLVLAAALAAVSAVSLRLYQASRHSPLLADADASMSTSAPTHLPPRGRSDEAP